MSQMAETNISIDGPLSNTYPCKLYVSGVLYGSAELAYLHAKAKMCGDEETEKLILAATSSRAARRLKTRLKPTSAWNDEKLGCMNKILEAKYAQCKEYREAISEATGTCIVDCTTHPFWGGHSGGKNRLGKLHDSFRHVKKRVLAIGCDHVERLDYHLSLIHEDREIDIICIPSCQIHQVRERIEQTSLYPYTDIYVIVGSYDLFTIEGERINTAEEVIAAMKHLQTTVALSTDARTRFSSIMPRGMTDCWPSTVLNKYNRDIKIINKTPGLKLVPLPRLWKSHELDRTLSKDGVHLVAEAKHYVAEQMFKSFNN